MTKKLSKLHLPGPSLADAAETYISEELPNALVRKESFTIERVYSHLSRHWPTDVALDDGEGYAVLIHLHKQFLKYIRDSISPFSPLHWLWLLRRVPDSVWRGRYLTTAGYDSALAEILAFSSTRTPSREPLDLPSTLAFDLRSSDVDSIAELIVLTRLLSDLHSAIRWSTKGATIAFDHPIFGKSIFWPRAIPSNELRIAVESYDRSVDVHGSYLQDWFGMGTSVLKVTGPDESWMPTNDNLLLVYALADNQLVQLPTRLFLPVPAQQRFGSLFETPIRYFPIQVNISRLKQLLNLGPILLSNSYTPLLIAIARVIQLVLTSRKPYVNLLSIMRRGYFVSQFEIATSQALLDEACIYTKELFPEFEPPKTLEKLLRMGAKVIGDVRPLRAGPPIVSDQNWFAFDLQSLTNRLRTEFEYTHEQGELANMRAGHWEKSVQTAIDQTHWSPTGALRSLVGRTIRSSGTPITDIDALAANGRKVILISCKSIPSRPDYDAGEYKDIRNASQAMEKNLHDWAITLSKIRKTPVGDNYDFADYDLFGLVVTPMPIFVHSPLARQPVVQGISAATSLTELKQALIQSQEP